MEEKFHIPVMLREVLGYLNLGPGKIIVDATIGTGGHSIEILKRIQPNGKIIGIDRDQESLDVCRERLRDFKDNVELLQGNFSDLGSLLGQLNIKKVDGMLFDLGISTFQLSDSNRGFSFQNEGPLDMRLDKSTYISAYDLLNNLNEQEISVLLRNYGQERWHNRIARLLVQERQSHPIATTVELANIVFRSIPYKFRRHHYRVHPATRTFQAVRIAVNRELENLEGAIDKAIAFLEKKARICFISFHSLEDRIVKLNFRRASHDGLINIITSKPLTPSREEVIANPSSRSSKLRVAEKR